jgi:hypothetical protein
MASTSSSIVGGTSTSFSGVQITARFDRFLLGTYSSATNSQAIQFVTFSQVYIVPNWINNSSGFVKFWVNVENPSGIGVANNAETRTSGNPTYSESTIGTFNYTFSGRINSIAVFIRGILPGGSGVQVNFYSGNMRFVDSTNDFNFIDATPSIAKLIKLPPITLESSGKLYFYKIKGFRNRNVYIYTYDDSVFADYNESGILLKDSYACATLFNDGVKWYIANYYPSPAQSYLPAVTADLFLSSKVGTASSNTINIFNTNGSSDRQNSNNLCMLPALNGNTAICTVVYAGSVDRLSNNGLIFSHYDEAIGSSRSIDNNPGYNSGRPCIIANESRKSNGIVFISDGTTWYIAGWFFGAYWGVSTDHSSISYDTISIGDLNSHSIRVSTGSGSNTQYRLPQDTPNETPYFLIVKGNPTTSRMVFNAHTGDRFISDNLKVIQMDGITSNICTWFVRQVISGVTRYYPVISYTPSAPL